MAVGSEVFKAIISAVDDSSGVIAKVRGGMEGLGKEAQKTGAHLSHVGHPSMWDRLREHTEEGGKHFDELGEHIKGVGEGIGGIGEHVSELLPMLAGLSAAGSIAGLAEIASSTAESFGELQHSAEKLGTSAQDLHELRGAVTLTDGSIEKMQKGLERLNITMADVKRGTNKNAAGLFKQLHIDPSQIHSSVDALTILADKFAHTTEEKMRGSMAMALFGKSGVDMIPMLMRGSAGLIALRTEARGLGADFTKSGKSLEEYNESQKKLSLSVEGFKDEIGAGLAPVFRPFIDDVRQAIVANKGWIATDLARHMHDLGEEVKAVDYHKWGAEIVEGTQDAEGLIDSIGGVKTVSEALFTYWAGKKIFSFGAEIVSCTGLIAKLGLTAASYVGVGTAATAAGLAEEKAAAGAMVSVNALGGAILAAGCSWIYAIHEINSALDDIHGSHDNDAKIPKNIQDQIWRREHPGAWRDPSIMGPGGQPIAPIAIPGGSTPVASHVQTYEEYHKEFYTGKDAKYDRVAGPYFAKAWANPDDVAHQWDLNSRYGGLAQPVPMLAALAARAIPELVAPGGGSQRGGSMPGGAAPGGGPIDVRVTVHFENAPEGTTATADTHASNVRISVSTANTGRAFHDHYPD